MADRSEKNIEDVQSGDAVISELPHGLGITTNSVVRCFTNYTFHTYHLYFEDENHRTHELRVTGEHPFRTKLGEWQKAKDLKPGQELFAGDAKRVTVSRIDVRSESGDTYNFSVSNDHNYFVCSDGIPILVHNAEYDIVPFRPTNPPNQNHHAIMDAWLKAHLPSYYQGRIEGSFPTIELSGPNHEKANTVFREWAREQTGQPVGGEIDWKSIPWEEMERLVSDMNNAAGVPESVQKAYKVAVGEWFVIRACR
jgi:hypothetical protein